MSRIIPSILAGDFSEFSLLIKKVGGLAPRLHLDIGDGEFSPSATFRDFAKIKSYPWPGEFDLHLMLRRPSAAEWTGIGAKRIFFHFESEVDVSDFCKTAKAAQIEPALAVKIETPLELIADQLKNFETVLLMTVEPGFYGSPFNENVLGRIRFLRDQWPSGKIMVDGGLNAATLPKAAAAGADYFVVGSALAKADDAGQVFKALSGLLEK